MTYLGFINIHTISIIVPSARFSENRFRARPYSLVDSWLLEFSRDDVLYEERHLTFAITSRTSATHPAHAIDPMRLRNTRKSPLFVEDSSGMPVRRNDRSLISRSLRD